jgi:NAD(P)-dependent dehydrogenase (short-subunit alcohol dehydrogenase family)
MPDRFRGKVAIVTGGAAGIGRASAEAFAREGATVHVLDNYRASGEETTARIEAAGGRAHFHHGDVAEDDDVRALVAAATEGAGRVDVMHANAGIEWTKKVVDTSLEEWARVIAVNLTGVYLACRFALVQMLEQRAGSIVITCSPHALSTVPDAGAYAASKGGVLALTRALALEAAPHGIRVNALLPGAIDTPMLRREAKVAGDPEQQLERFAAIHPLNRLGRAEEIAEVALFLASDAASFVTGAAIPVEGGLLAAQPSGPPISYGD